MDMTSFEAWLQEPLQGRPQTVRSAMDTVAHAIHILKRHGVAQVARNTLELRGLIEKWYLGQGYLEALTEAEIAYYPRTLRL